MLQHWRTFWFVPAIFAGVITLIFAILFKEKEQEHFSVLERA
jgi:hypothetical protein